MIEVQVCKARGARFGVEEPEALTIVADTPIDEDAGPDRSLATFRRDAALIAEALWKALPGGTLDRIVALLLERKASQFHVPHGAFDKPDPAFEPAIDAHLDAVWLTNEGYVNWLPEGETAPDGWRRLHVEPVTDGGTG